MFASRKHTAFFFNVKRKKRAIDFQICQMFPVSLQHFMGLEIGFLVMREIKGPSKPVPLLG